MQCPKAALFDLDNTLADPFHPPKEEMLERFKKLLSLRPVAIMSAASLQRIQKDVLQNLGNTDLSSLTLFAANAAQSYIYREGTWQVQYQFSFSDIEREHIRATLRQCVTDLGIITDKDIAHDKQFVDYQGYVAFTALGVGAPVEDRKAWDPDASKRQSLRAALQEKLPEFDIYIGGSTSVDITPKKINKAYGINWYSKFLHIPTSEMLFVGDALYEGGNDNVVIETGVQTRSTSGPEETLSIMDELLTACVT